MFFSSETKQKSAPPHEAACAAACRLSNVRNPNGFRIRSRRLGGAGERKRRESEVLTNAFECRSTP